MDAFSRSPRPDSEPFRVWSCGCARGEETYSFKILWETLKQTTKALPKLQLWATDMNEDYLTMAELACYELRSLKEIPEIERDRWFEKVPGKKLFHVKSAVRSGVIFKRLNFLREPPPAKNLHMVFARNNLMTYFRFPEKEKALKRITDALMPQGVLIVGSHEKIPHGFAFLKRHKASDLAYINNRSSIVNRRHP